MKINAPCIITPRLLPGVKIDNAFIGIEYAGLTSEGRQRYRYYIDFGDYSYIAHDLKSGCGGGNLQEGLESLLSFMSAVESFPEGMHEWLRAHSDELSMLAAELEEAPNLIEE